MRRLMNGLAVCLALYGFSASAALPVEGGTTTKEGINVPTPADGGGAEATKVKGPLSEILRLKEGDTLHGNMMLIEDGKLTWSRPDINAPIVMGLENIKGIRLFKQSPEIEGSKVELTNGDIIYGEVVSLNGEDFVVDTWYGGRLTVPRSMVRLIRPGSTKGPVILESIGKLTDWTDQSGSWSARQGILTARGNGRIGRLLKLPEAIHLQVTVAWNGSNPSFNIVTYTNDASSFYNDCFNLRISRSYISLQAGQGNRDFGNTRYNKLSELKSAKVDLFIDKKKQVIVLMINNDLVKKWDNINYSPGGSGVLLNSGYSNTSFSKMRITEWDGKLPTPKASGKGEKNENLVRFTNGDKMSGKIIEIKDGKVTLKTQFATMPVPMKNIANMVLNIEGSEDFAEARKNKGDINLFFPSGDKLTMELIGYKDGKITGKSENFGTKVFDTKAFIGLKFNIYDEKGDTEDGDTVYDLLFHE